MYGSGELYLWVQNDEGLYMEFNRLAKRATYMGVENMFSQLKLMLEDYFVFTDEQEEELRESFESEVEELIKEEEEDSE